MSSLFSELALPGQLSICCRPHFHQTPTDTFLGILGYCRKEQNLPIYSSFNKAITPEMERQADDIFAKYGAGGIPLPDQVLLSM